MSERTSRLYNILSVVIAVTALGGDFTGWQFFGLRRHRFGHLTWTPSIVSGRWEDMQMVENVGTYPVLRDTLISWIVLQTEYSTP